MMDGTSIHKHACALFFDFHDPPPEPLIVAPNVLPDALAGMSYVDIPVHDVLMAAGNVRKDRRLLSVGEQLVHDIRVLAPRVCCVPEGAEHAPEAAWPKNFHLSGLLVGSRGRGGSYGRHA